MLLYVLCGPTSCLLYSLLVLYVTRVCLSLWGIRACLPECMNGLAVCFDVSVNFYSQVYICVCVYVRMNVYFYIYICVCVSYMYPCEMGYGSWPVHVAVTLQVPVGSIYGIYRRITPVGTEATVEGKALDIVYRFNDSKARNPPLFGPLSTSMQTPTNLAPI